VWVRPRTYCDFADKDDLIEAVLDDLIQVVQDNAGRASHIEDPYEAFRAVFSRSCDMSEREVASFLRLAGASRRADEHANRLITAVIGPAASRLREVGGLRPDITVDDITMFIRMTVAADNEKAARRRLTYCSPGSSARPSTPPARVFRHDGWHQDLLRPTYLLAGSARAQQFPLADVLGLRGAFGLEQVDLLRPVRGQKRCWRRGVRDSKYEAGDCDVSWPHERSACL
jgi:hypothetical protein